MHDIGGTFGEFGEGIFPEINESNFEFEAISEFGPSNEIASPFNEAQEMELAGELLSLTNEMELNHFLGDLMKKAVSSVGSVKMRMTKLDPFALRQAIEEKLTVIFKISSISMLCRA